MMPGHIVCIFPWVTQPKTTFLLRLLLLTSVAWQGRVLDSSLQVWLVAEAWVAWAQVPPQATMVFGRHSSANMTVPGTGMVFLCLHGHAR
jgi:hypothetical protein